MGSVIAQSTTTVLGAVAVSVFAAIVAAVGFLAKLYLDWRDTRRQSDRERRSQLLQLRDLLQATKVSFYIQNSHARTLAGTIRSRSPGLAEGSLEKTLSRADEAGAFSEDEKELFALIRGISSHSLYQSNLALLAWLRSDAYFKAQFQRDDEYGKLAKLLSQLQVHLLLWMSKFEMWIPGRPEHALVYMADEEAHGIAFPAGIDEVVASLLIRDS